MSPRRSLSLIPILFLSLIAASILAADVAGDWTLKVSAPDGDHAAKLSITQEGEKISGALSGDQGQFKLEGTVKGEEIQFTVHYTGDEPMAIPFNGKLQGDKMAGEYRAGDITGNWSAEKAK